MDMRRDIRRLSYIVLPLVWAAAVCMSCGTVKDDEPQITETCAVLNTADSLRAQGVLMDDSIALARAVTALGSHQRSHADDYVRACYYYGCLLRKRNNQTAAMQTFINAIHTENDEHTILGQVYCNMGIICYQEGDFQLAYEMHSLSARQHKLANDTVRYNYALYEMAYALMKQRKKDSAMLVLADIEHNTSDAYTLSLVYLTKASLYRDLQQYDSALYYAGRELELNPQEGTGLMVKAQSFSMLNMKDSAVYYAKLAKTRTSSWDNLINIYYILAHDDNTIDENTRQQYHADRADIQTLTKQRQGRLAQAVMLLQQDMDRKPDYKWLYAAILTALLMTALVAGRHIVTRKKHAEEKRKRQEDTANYNRFLKQAETLLAELENTCTIMRQCQDIKTQLCWNDYGQMCRVINKQFSLLADRLGQIDGIHETDIRLCVLVLIGFSLETIADILPCSPNSVKTLKRRTALKLGTNSRDLRMFLLKMAANMPV